MCLGHTDYFISFSSITFWNASGTVRPGARCSTNLQLQLLWKAGMLHPRSAKTIPFLKVEKQLHVTHALHANSSAGLVHCELCSVLHQRSVVLTSPSLAAETPPLSSACAGETGGALCADAGWSRWFPPRLSRPEHVRKRERWCLAAVCFVQSDEIPTCRLYAKPSFNPEVKLLRERSSFAGCW